MVKVIQANKKEILLNNAYESWIQAIKLARNIKDGLVTLQYKKSFVSNLHNAVELFLKQLMLNQQDYRIAYVKTNNIHKDGNPLKTYYQATNLNEYFKNLTQEQRQHFLSIKFNDLINIHKDLFINSPVPKISYKSALILLQRLRNNETHFYIEAEDFLNEKDFVTLHNFMIDFNKNLEQENLFPFIGTPLEEESLLYFDDQKIESSNFSFKHSIEISTKAKKIANILNTEIFKFFAPPYALAKVFSKEFTQENILFDEALSYIESLFTYRLIDIQEEYAEVEDEYGRVAIDCIGFKYINKF